jgi:6,7-dimethyl-8-ribityllumazine synthase
VPGAVEIPFAVQRLAQLNRYDAIIALGAVIRGETTHYDYVCEQVSQGCQRVMLDFDCPVIFGVLTTENEAQALDRVGGNHGHKGKDALDCALQMIAIDHLLSDS